MKNQHWRLFAFMLGSLFLFASFIYINQSENDSSFTNVPDDKAVLISENSTLSGFPRCDASNGLENYICTPVVMLACYPNYCNSPTAPAVCLCSTDGINLNSVTHCQRVGHRGANTEKSEKKEMDLASVIDQPIAVFAAPYNGNTNCSIVSGKCAMVTNNTSKTKQSKSPVRLCKGKCKDSMKWSFVPVDKNDLTKGFHIQPVGQTGQYLALDKTGGLTLASKSENMTEESLKRISWNVGAGEFKNGKVTGYRIISNADFTTGLVANEKTGTVTIKQIFQRSEKGKQAFQVNPDLESIWTFESAK